MSDAGTHSEGAMADTPKLTEECQRLSIDGFPCHLRRGHDGPHVCLDKDYCPHHWTDEDRWLWLGSITWGANAQEQTR